MKLKWFHPLKENKMKFKFYSEADKKRIKEIANNPNRKTRTSLLREMSKETGRSFSALYAKMSCYLPREFKKYYTPPKPVKEAVVTETVIEFALESFEIVTRDGQLYARLKIKK